MTYLVRCTIWTSTRPSHPTWTKRRQRPGGLDSCHIGLILCPIDLSGVTRCEDLRWMLYSCHDDYVLEIAVPPCWSWSVQLETEWRVNHAPISRKTRVASPITAATSSESAFLCKSISRFSRICSPPWLDTHSQATPSRTSSSMMFYCNLGLNQ